MTYGQLKFRLAKAFPGVDADLVEGWIQDRYAEILGELPWSRQNKIGVLQGIPATTHISIASHRNHGRDTAWLDFVSAIWVSGSGIPMKFALLLLSFTPHQTRLLTCEPITARWHQRGQSCEEQLARLKKLGWRETRRWKLVGVDSEYYRIEVKR